MQCPQCRIENPPQSAMCTACGSPLGRPPDAPRRHPSPASLIRREFAILAFGLLVFALAAGGAWYLVTRVQSPASVVERFVEADMAARFAEQRQYVSGGWSADLALALFQRARTQLGRSPFERYRIVNVRRDDAVATVDVEIDAPVFGGATPGRPPAKPDRVTVRFALERVGDQWRIEPASTLANALVVFVAHGMAPAGPGGGAAPQPTGARPGP